jgi:hypothetical protein
MSLSLIKQDRLERRVDSHPQGTAEGRASTPYFVITNGGKPIHLVDQARADGLQNLPESSAIEPGEIESTVTREHERQHLERAERTQHELHELKVEFEELEDQLPRVENLESTVDQALAGIEHDLAADHTLPPLRQEEQRQRRDLRAFVRQHRLAREPRYPTSRLLHFGIVGLLVVAESLANAGFFAPVSTLGLIGGFLLAVAVSAVNVFSGLMTGFFCVRGLHHFRRPLRWLAGCGVVVYGLFTLGFNVALGQYRDLAATAGINAHLPLRGLLSNPLDLSLTSAALVVTGVIMSLLALWKGYRLDDPVPGYGEKHRNLVAASQALQQLTNSLRRRVLGRVEAAAERCQAILNRAEGIVKQLQAATVRAEHTLDGYETHRAHLEHQCELLLRRYRDENQAIRTNRAPTYFASFPIFPSLIDHTVPEELVARLGRASDALDGLKAEAHRLRREQADRVKQAAQRFEECLHEQFRRADEGRGDGSGPLSAPIQSVRGGQP